MRQVFRPLALRDRVLSIARAARAASLRLKRKHNGAQLQQLRGRPERSRRFSVTP